MNQDELVEKLKMNILATDMSMMDAPYFGFSGEKIRGVEFAINKILEGTDLTIKGLIKESNEKNGSMEADKIMLAWRKGEYDEKTYCISKR